MHTFATGRRLVVFALCGGIAGGFFALDVALPRGATAAIGYCIVPVLVGATRQRRLLIAATIVCVLLTWVGYILEPAGAARWMSIFDRSVVSIVLCTAAVLSWRRARELNALEAAREQLEDTNDQLKTFAAVVAHDIRGPLNTIALYNELVASSPAVRGDP